MTDVSFPPLLSSLLDRIDDLARGRALVCYAVGGTVRDALLARDSADVDIAVDHDAMTFAHALAAVLGGHFVELDDAGAVARVVLVDGDVKHIDVAQLQGTLEEDLVRRDLTIDALAAPVIGGTVTDVTDGLRDIDTRLIRTTSGEAFDADPLRMLRAVRIAGELGFDIEPTTAEQIRESAPRVRGAAAERRRDELARIFALDAAYPSVVRLDELGLLDVLLPELTFGRGVTQPENHHSYDVFEHALRAVEAVDWMLAGTPATMFGEALWHELGWCEAELRAYFEEELSEGRSRGAALKVAALLHDVAKPQTRSVDEDGRVRFLGHADEGAVTAARIMRRYRFSAREVAFVTKLVAEHLRPVQLAAVGEVPSRRAIYRFYRVLGDAVPAVLFLALADAAASRGPRMTLDGWTRHVRYMGSLLVRSAEDAGIVDPPRLLSGRDIMARFGVPEGPRVGALLEELREAQAAGDVRDRSEAIVFIGERVGDTNDGDERAP